MRCGSVAVANAFKVWKLRVKIVKLKEAKLGPESNLIAVSEPLTSRAQVGLMFSVLSSKSIRPFFLKESQDY